VRFPITPSATVGEEKKVSSLFHVDSGDGKTNEQKGKTQLHRSSVPQKAGGLEGEFTKKKKKKKYSRTGGKEEKHNTLLRKQEDKTRS